MAGLVILALADPVRNAIDKVLGGTGPVLVMVDDGWTGGLDWDGRKAVLDNVVREAAQASRPVALVFASEAGKADLTTKNPDDILARVAAADPKPMRTDWGPIAEKLTAEGHTYSSVMWMTSGLAEEGTDELSNALAGTNADETLIYGPDQSNALALAAVDNQADAMVARLVRVKSSAAQSGTATAYDVKGRSLASTSYEFKSGDSTADARFALPVELRNEFVRVAIDGSSTAGAVQLLDDRFRRRRVGLISGENSDRAQPLLSPLYYISRALSPFSEVREADDANLLNAVTQLIDERASTLVLADIGTLPDEALSKVNEWIDRGGILVRFAGPRLAAANDDTLTPVQLRRGDRSLGGTLTWGTPQPLASFDEDSPFSGIIVPGDVEITRQVLAEPAVDLDERTWASLADGTPLVTAAKRGKGWIVLFHVTADAGWSNLPLSGAFVDMLRRIVSVSNGAVAGGTATNDAVGERSTETSAAQTVLPPLRTINGFGTLVPPASGVEPLTVGSSVTLANPPGLYGTNEAFVALNIFNADADLRAFDSSAPPAGAKMRTISTAAPLNIKPWLLAAALLLLALDCLAVLWMAGAFQRRFRPAISMLAVLMAISFAGESYAQSNEQFDFASALKTRLAYVRTGVGELDTISLKGLKGLTAFIASRTSLEPGEPIGLDIANDELSFYPLLYWPLSENSPVPGTKTMARIDAFMKKGGSVLFDTRDQLSGGFGGGQVSGATQKLRDILESLDIPPLEPVPENHVLTRAFYLLDLFPGRYLDGKLWVEASDDESSADRPTRQGDGVSSIMITSNDLAGAWAVEPSGAPTLPIVPPNPTQRIYAYRTGVNLMMYTLTGNYKSDQVHIPALLERLGQ